MEEVPEKADTRGRETSLETDFQQLDLHATHTLWKMLGDEREWWEFRSSRVRPLDSQANL